MKGLDDAVAASEIPIKASYREVAFATCRLIAADPGLNCALRAQVQAETSFYKRTTLRHRWACGTATPT